MFIEYISQLDQLKIAIDEKRLEFGQYAHCTVPFFYQAINAWSHVSFIESKQKLACF